MSKLLKNLFSSQTNKWLWRLCCIVLATLLIRIFWQNSALTFWLLLGLVGLMNLRAEKSELSFFLIVAIIATLLESLAMSTGAWSYSHTQILNFPIWLPLYWGMGGVVMKDTFLAIERVSLKTQHLK